MYGTITLTSVLIVYDGWQQLGFRDVVGMIVGPAIDVFLQPGQAVSMSLNYSCLLDVMRKVMQEDQRCAAKGVALAAAKPRLLPLLSAHLSFTEIAQELFLPNISSRRRTRSTGS